LTDAPQSAGLVALAERIELWPIHRVRPYERNPRTHSDAQVDQIAASMVEFGWTNPILIDENAGILAGHGRLLAARKLWFAEVPVIRFEHLSEAQNRPYLIADNQLGLQAGWSEELLAQELAWLRDESFDLDLVGSRSPMARWRTRTRTTRSRTRRMSRSAARVTSRFHRPNHRRSSTQGRFSLESFPIAKAMTTWLRSRIGERGFSGSPTSR
jgi:ParB-like nuclease domain